MPYAACRADKDALEHGVASPKPERLSRCFWGKGMVRLLCGDVMMIRQNANGRSMSVVSFVKIQDGRKQSNDQMISLFSNIYHISL